MMKKHLFKVTLRVRNDVGVLTRITTRLRKFRINITSMDAAPIADDPRFTDIHMNIESELENIDVPMKKTEQLIPVVSAKYEKVK